jgi:UDP:flavonoid glycosyltransferase YjiC (YdhE family)
VLFLNVPLHGHINPTLDLASELVLRGNEVVYYASASFREKVEATGAEFR